MLALPTIAASGPPITSLCGHCWHLGGEAAGADQLRAAVRERAQPRVDVVKVMTSGGDPRRHGGPGCGRRPSCTAMASRAGCAPASMADLLVVGGDHSADTTALERVLAVMLRGRWVVGGPARVR